MNRIEQLDRLPREARGGAVSIGNFDGVHRGHARIAGELAAAARLAGGPAIVFTFDPHPAQLLRPQSTPPLLTTLPRRAELLAELGIDAVVVCRTTTEILRRTAEEFFQQVLVEQLAAKAIIEGPNFLFGRDRTGNIQTLAGLCDQAHVRLDVVPPFAEGGEMVSSSRVRDRLLAGDIVAANQLLTRPYRLAGIVREGARRGRQLGFPTANLHEIVTLIPGPGVYAGATHLDGQWRAAAIHVGPNPTFGELQAKVEVHLPGWSGDLYGASLAVDMLSRVRDIHSFASVADLTQQLGRDVAEACRRFDQALPTLTSRSPHGA